MHNKEQRSIIRFLSSEGVKPIEIHRLMKVQYGDACLSLQQIAAHLDMSHGSVYHIVPDVLQFHKMFNRLRDKKILKVFI